MNYKDLDDALGAEADGVHKNPELGRLHDALCIEVRNAQGQFDLDNADNPAGSFSRERLSPAVCARYDALRKEAAYYKITLPNIYGED